MQRLPTQFDPETSHQLERLAARAWPADEVQQVEGWLLRRTVGVDRRRCNSLLPPADSLAAVRTLELALATAEKLGVAAVIQVSPAEAHRPLDEALEDRGMAFGDPSLVLAGPLRAQAAVAADITIQIREGPPEPGPVASPPAFAVQLGDLDDEWVEAWTEVSGTDGTRATADLVLSQLGDRARFAIAVDAPSSVPLGVGIGVAEKGWLGLFSLAVTPAARHQGIASAIVDALEGWSATAGAERVYLQVEADNAAALAFYARRGFFIAHSYHYRSA
ncbi:MAG TPA: GNAT family N-acetyltransferase [Baekduia sp.]|nr:GNAT family N-acetyltransferase [Baekduia sp.]